MYDVHLGLIGKRVVDFLLVIIELFSLIVTTAALRAIIGSRLAISLQRGPADPKSRVEQVAPTNQIFLPFYHNSRVSQTDRQIDGRTDRQNSHRKTASAFHAGR